MTVSFKDIWQTIEQDPRITLRDYIYRESDLPSLRTSIQELKERKQWTWDFLADEIGIKKSTLHSFVLAERTRVSFKTLCKIGSFIERFQR